MSDERTHNGNNADFNEVPSWYQEQTPPPPAPNAPEALLGRANMSHQAAAPKSGSFMSSFGKSMLGRGLVVLVLLPIGWFFGRGTTSAEALDVGDCFLMSDSEVIDRLDTPDCTDPHDSQVVGLVAVQSESAAYPGPDDPYWDEVFINCQNAAVANVVNEDTLPFDAQLEMFTPREAGWDAGERDSICVIHSPGGLSGSFVTSDS